MNASPSSLRTWVEQEKEMVELREKIEELWGAGRAGEGGTKKFI